MKILFKSTLLILFVLMSCATSDSIEEQPDIVNTDGSFSVGSKDIEATKVTISGVVVNSDDQFNFTTLDLDISSETSTTLTIENYKNSYKYQLKLKGSYTDNVYYVNIKNIEAEKNTSINNVSPSVSNTTVGVDLSGLEMLSDFYTAKLIEVDSGNELSLENNTSTNSTEIRFIDQGSDDFYTTIRASDTSGAISSTGHPKGYGLKLETYKLSKAKAFIIPGNTQRLAFYKPSDKSLIKSTQSPSRYSSTSTNGGQAYYTYLIYLSPERIGVVAGDYLIRMEELNASGTIIKSSPYQKFKIK
ncbi:hypothetical protein FHR24_001219 [Wenyingzhuangia heitensis]|uniref:DUF4397 domain-containing protein n=1 Tax=Wenyingzhuangia heitensis TaxID=1487859 RepID=A0ABX0U9Z8_9FLAO|nr:hypothetical protein [Wenyingzhuangia heitensis]NIJ44780.1 hypothetical protein [Wenyingzhuangia heitensis]